jgi:hypothetical protein
MDTLHHIRHFAETIGPRGSTTAQEAEAARYAAQSLQAAGLMPVTETFISAKSAYYPLVFFAGLVTVSAVLFWVGGQWGAVAALILSALAFLCLLLELAFRPNPYRWVLPKGKSQNVWAKLPAQGEARRQVVLIGHLDSHRTPLLFSSSGWVKFLGLLVPIGVGATLALFVLFSLGIFAPNPLWQILSLPLAGFIVLMLVLFVQADLTPYAPGASDDASGAAAVLTAAQRLANAPLEHTSVWFVLSGCEEVGSYGAAAFAKAHRQELGNALWLTLENFGGKGADPAYLTSETFLLTTRSDLELVQLAAQIAAAKPELNAFPFNFKGAYTDSAVGAIQGMRVLTIIGFGRDGSLPEWHRMSDSLENIAPDVLQRCETFLWELLQAIDQQG